MRKQGMNSSIQDSVSINLIFHSFIIYEPFCALQFNLAWKLALVTKSLSSPTLLSSYNSERFPVIAEMLNISTELHNKNFDPKTENPWARGGKLLQLGVNYRSSGIIVDETKEGEGEVNVDSYSVDGFLKGGDRAPDAPGLIDLQANTGTSTRFFDIFKPYHHTALVFADGTIVEKMTLILQALQRYPPGTIRSVIVRPQGTKLCASNGGHNTATFVLEDQEGHAYQGYAVEPHAQDVAVLIVRPDGVVGGLVHGVEGIEKYFGGIFKISD